MDTTTRLTTALNRLLDRHSPFWEGSASELLERLGPDFPVRHPNRLAQLLRKHLAEIEANGISIKFSRSVTVIAAA